MNEIQRCRQCFQEIQNPNRKVQKYCSETCNQNFNRRKRKIENNVIQFFEYVEGKRILRYSKKKRKYVLR